MRPLLSILIPTYNRAKETARALQSIVSQIDPAIASKVEILVSDNASSDQTDLAVAPFISNIKYFKQPINIGAESNFSFLLDNSIGTYKWIFGSDDLLLRGALASIVSVLESGLNIGLLHIRGTGSINPLLNEQAVIRSAKFYVNQFKFVEDISFLMTFITANIFNSELLPRCYRTEQGIGTSLMQLYPYLYTILSSRVNAVLPGRLYVSQADNFSGGFIQLQVFGPNMWEIFRFFSVRGLPLSSFNVVGSHMCVQYYPHYIAYRKTGRHATLVPGEKDFSILFSIYKFNIWFWLASAPIFILGPKGLFISRAVSLLYKAYRLVVRIFVSGIIFGRSRSI